MMKIDLLGIRSYVFFKYVLGALCILLSLICKYCLM